MLRLGPFEIYSVITGTFGLDGGAMFGVVPRALWSHKVEPDELNRIPLATRTLLVIHRDARRVFLVDTGCGTKWAPDKADRFAIRLRDGAIDIALQVAGLSPQDVTDVVVTHLHFDHNGGLTEWVDQPDGATRLCFPQARHWIHRKHWEHAHHPHVKDRASFLPEDFEALEGSNVLQFVKGDRPEPPCEGVEWFVSHGHTPYQLHPVFGHEGSRILFVGDLVPTLAHLRPAWVMAYDVLPMTTIDEKCSLFRRAIEEGLLLAFAHDPECGGVALGGTVDRPIVTKPLPL